MSLYERMYDATTAAEGYREIAAAAEDVAEEIAKDFVSWYRENSILEYYKDLDVFELYEQFKMTL